MTTLFKIVVLTLVIGGLLLWAASVLPQSRSSSVASVPGERLVASPLPARNNRLTTLTGIVVYDKGPEPPVPYIAYRLQGGGTRTKQLILRNDRGCSPAAGDIPCANGDPGSFPNLPEGTTIRVTGVVDADQILVESLESA